ncbi:hypothetical protein LCGC14_2733700, partial [marine sediment metagenome]
FMPAMSALAKIMTVMGEPLGPGGLADLKDAKNVAMVTVTATIPEAGARQGDKIDCVVSSIGAAKDLTGGRLFHTALVGPDKNNPTVYAFADGPITIEDTTLTTGRIHRGCRLEAEFFNEFTLDGKVTIVLDKNHADFGVAQYVVDLINRSLVVSQGNRSGPSGRAPAKALDQSNIEIEIPTAYLDDPVLFISEILDEPLIGLDTGARVVINERAGSIVISGDVEIGAVIVNHRNVVIETGNVTAGQRFVSIDPDDTSAVKLKSLIEALNAIHVPTDDVIDIIKGLERNGKLHAKLIIE